MKTVKEKLMNFVLVAALVLPGPAMTFGQAAPSDQSNKPLFASTVGERKVVAQVGDHAISSDLIRLVLSEELTQETDAQKLTNGFIKASLLSKESERIGLDQSPRVRELVQHEWEHMESSLLLKLANPDKRLGQLRKSAVQTAAGLSYNQVQLPQIEYIRNMSTEQIALREGEGYDKRQIVLAKVNGEDITVQSLMDEYQSYQEFHFWEDFSVNPQATIQRYVEKKVRREQVKKLKQSYPVLNELFTALKNKVVARCLTGLYLDKFAEYPKDERGEEYHQMKVDPVTEAEMEAYFAQHPEPFKKSACSQPELSNVNSQERNRQKARQVCEQQKRRAAFEQLLQDLRGKERIDIDPLAIDDAAPAECNGCAR